MTKTKSDGGLGIRCLRDMNMTCMAKLRWHFKTEGTSLWAQVLVHKYKNVGHGSHIKVSNAWKGIMAARHIVDNGLIKVVRNGCSTRFWMDKWIGDQLLHQQMKASVSLPELYVNVNEYWEEGKGWKWELIWELIPPETANKLAGVVLSDDAEDGDDIGWSNEENEKFSIRSAYDFITTSPRTCGNFE